MLVDYQRGQTSVILRVKIYDSSVTTGAGKTGLTSSTSGLIISTIANNEASATAYTVAGSTIESITTLGTYAAPTATKCRFKEVDATNHPGIYEIQIADARFAVSAAKALVITISGATGAAQCDALIPLRDVNPYDGVRGGMTALPNAAAEAAGGLFTRGTGAGQINQGANGRIDVNLKAIAGATAGATNLDRSARAIAIGTVGSSSTTTSIVTSALDPAAAVSDQFKGRVIVFDRDTTTTNLRGQATDISASTSGGVLTVSALSDAPQSGDTFTVL